MHKPEAPPRGCNSYYPPLYVGSPRARDDRASTVHFEWRQSRAVYEPSSTRSTNNIYIIDYL